MGFRGYGPVHRRAKRDRGARGTRTSGNRDEAVETLLRLKMAGEGSDDWEQLLGGG